MSAFVTCRKIIVFFYCVLVVFVPELHLLISTR